MEFDVKKSEVYFKALLKGLVDLIQVQNVSIPEDQTFCIVLIVSCIFPSLVCVPSFPDPETEPNLTLA